jgi:GR25 family glycosyltransferase involved in LPS biosynthesis
MINRWKKELTLANKSGLLLHRISAVDALNSIIPERDVALTWDTTLNSQFDSQCAAMHEVAMTASERACAASHLKVWREILTFQSSAHCSTHMRSFYSFHENVDRSLNIPSTDSPVISPKLPSPDSNVFVIFEDDADIKSYGLASFRSEVLNIIHKASSLDWDIIYLGGVIPKKSLKFKSKRMKSGYFLKVNYIWMLHAYIINAKAVKKIIAHLPIIGPVDNFIAMLIHEEVLSALLLKDVLVDQSGGAMTSRLTDSDIIRSGVSATTTIRGYKREFNSQYSNDDKRKKYTR